MAVQCWRPTCILLLFLLSRMALALPSPAEIQAQLEAYRGGRFGVPEAPGGPGELGALWGYLLERPQDLPPVYRILGKILIPLMDRIEGWEGEPGGNPEARRELDSTMALCHFAALSLIEAQRRGDGLRPHPCFPEFFREVLRSMAAPTNRLTFRFRLPAVLIFSRSNWSPPIHFQSIARLWEEPPPRRFFPGARFGGRFAYSHAVAGLIDDDLARLRKRLQQVPGTPPPNQPFPLALTLILVSLVSAGTSWMVARGRPRNEPPPAPANPPVLPEPTPAPLALPATTGGGDEEESEVLPLIEALEEVRARVVHSLTGRLAIARVLEDEPERFREAFLTPEVLRETAELLEGERGLIPMIERLEVAPLDRVPELSRGVTSLVRELPRYRNLAEKLRQILAEVQLRRVPRTISRFQGSLVRVAEHFKAVNQVLREVLGRYRLDTEDLLEELIPRFQGRLSLELDVRGRSDLICLQSQKLREDLELVMDCLLENAFQARARTAVARWVGSDEELRLELRDDGEGLLGQDPQKLLAGGVSSKPLGTGTGLANCRKILQSWGGSLAMTPGVGKGAVLILSLPRRPRKG